MLWRLLRRIVAWGRRWLDARRDVSGDWARDAERREWSRGEDGVCWKWPVRR